MQGTIARVPCARVHARPGEARAGRTIMKRRAMCVGTGTARPSSADQHTASCLDKYAKECKKMAAGANIAHATDVVASQKMSLG